MNLPTLNRATSLQRIRTRETPWDVLIIGGGATGIGTALDAASRGLETVLLERFDFGSGTSSRSTKLVHGGVRYLKQGNITLVRDALRERTLLRQNAPHLVHDMPFVIPCASLWEWFFYGVGLKVYDLLATGDRFGKSHFISAQKARDRSPALAPEKLRGGVLYHDGQFDDARLLINMARTASDHGACMVNHAPVVDFLKDSSGNISGVVATDIESNERFEVESKVVVNAAGPFCDAVRMMDDKQCDRMLAASQGVHIVLPREMYPGETAMIVPKTSDGRVIFIIPWHGHTVVGTTDTAIPESIPEPKAQETEIQFLLETSARFLQCKPTAEDVLSVFTGIRPLVKGDKSARTASLSRDHVIRTSDSGLITITGGKWTTVRKMAEDCVDRIATQLDQNLSKCKTESMPIHGSQGCDQESSPGITNSRQVYGSDLPLIEQLEEQHPAWRDLLHPDLPIRKSEIVWAARHEMACTVEDALARRTRALFLNATAAVASASETAKLIADERSLDKAWCDEQVAQFTKLAETYQVGPSV